MRWVCKAQNRPAHSELYAVAVIKRRGRSDALVVDERAVEASQVMKDKLAVRPPYLRMATRDDGCRSLNRHFHLRVSAKPRDILTNLYASKLSGRRADDLDRGWLRWSAALGS
jgi:hypothetical protein